VTLVFGGYETVQTGFSGHPNSYPKCTARSWQKCKMDRAWCL